MYYLTADQYRALQDDGLPVTAAPGQPITITNHADKESRAAAILAVGAVAARNRTNTRSLDDAMRAAATRSATNTGVELTNVVLAADHVRPDNIHDWPDYRDGTDNRGNFTVLGSLHAISAAVRADNHADYEAAIAQAVDDGATAEQIADAYHHANTGHGCSFARTTTLPAPSRAWITVHGEQLTAGDRLGWPYFVGAHQPITAISGAANGRGNRIALTEAGHVVPICRHHRYGIEHRPGEHRAHAGY